MIQELWIWWVLVKCGFMRKRYAMAAFAKTEQAKVVGFYGGIIPAVGVWLWLCVEHIYLSAGG